VERVVLSVVKISYLFKSYQVVRHVSKHTAWGYSRGLKRHLETLCQLHYFHGKSADIINWRSQSPVSCGYNDLWYRLVGKAVGRKEGRQGMWKPMLSLMGLLEAHQPFPKSRRILEMGTKKTRGRTVGKNQVTWISAQWPPQAL
jgi:hypothetical protein